MEILTKYKIGDTLWTIKNCKAISGAVKSVNIFAYADRTSITYSIEGTSDMISEELAFLTKEELIEQL